MKPEEEIQIIELYNEWTNKRESFNASALVLARSFEIAEEREDDFVFKASFKAFYDSYKEQEKLFKKIIEYKEDLEEIFK